MRVLIAGVEIREAQVRRMIGDVLLGWTIYEDRGELLADDPDLESWLSQTSCLPRYKDSAGVQSWVNNVLSTAIWTYGEDFDAECCNRQAVRIWLRKYGIPFVKQCKADSDARRDSEQAERDRQNAECEQRRVNELIVQLAQAGYTVTKMEKSDGNQD